MSLPRRSNRSCGIRSRSIPGIADVTHQIALLNRILQSALLPFFLPADARALQQRRLRGDAGGCARPAAIPQRLCAVRSAVGKKHANRSH